MRLVILHRWTLLVEPDLGPDGFGWRRHLAGLLAGRSRTGRLDRSGDFHSHRKETSEAQFFAQLM